MARTSGGQDAPRALPDGPVPLIYNPAAGGGRGRMRFKEAEALFALRDIELEAIPTEHPGHATDLAYELSGTSKVLFVMGGDGTLSEASEGVLNAGHDPLLGFIPAGTGNDFLREFGFQDRLQAIDRITMGRPRRIDAAKLQYGTDGDIRTRHWINIFGTGFAAQAAATANQRFKWAGGQAYNLGVLSELMRLKASPTRVVLDGVEHTGNYQMVMVCNSVHTGGAMQMAPMARPDDGLLDVLTVEGVGKAELIRLLAKVRDGGHVSHHKVRFDRAKKIHIEPTRPSPLLVDGEVMGTTPVDIDVMPGALQILL